MSAPARSNDSAFPRGTEVMGMTLRQWYIGMALQGVLAAGRDRDLGLEGAARMAIEAADKTIRLTENSY